MNMSEELKKECLQKLIARYARRNREGRSGMLDELCEDYKYERKYAIKLLGGALPPSSGRVDPGPERLYEIIEPVVKHIWLSAEQPCGKRLVPILRQWLPFYELRHGRFSCGQRQLVRQISAATLDRLLAPARAQHGDRGRKGKGVSETEQRHRPLPEFPCPGFLCLQFSPYSHVSRAEYPIRAIRGIRGEKYFGLSGIQSLSGYRHRLVLCQDGGLWIART